MDVGETRGNDALEAAPRLPDSVGDGANRLIEGRVYCFPAASGRLRYYKAIFVDADGTQIAEKLWTCEHHASTAAHSLIETALNAGYRVTLTGPAEIRPPWVERVRQAAMSVGEAPA